MNQFCQECGQRLDSNTRFCPNCGASVPVEEPLYRHREQPQPVFPGSVEEPKNAPKPKKKKGKVGLVIGIVAAVAALAVGIGALVHFLPADEDERQNASEQEDEEDGEIAEPQYVLTEMTNEFPDGDKIVYKYAYDTHGNRVSGKMIRNGVEEYTMEYECDEDHRITKEKTYYGGTLERVLTYSYNADGTTESYIVEFKASEQVQKCVYSYDDDGNVDEMEIYFDDVLSANVEFEYNFEEQTKTASQYDANGDLVVRTEYILDEDGNMISSECRSADGELQYTGTWKYEDLEEVGGMDPDSASDTPENLPEDPWADMTEETEPEIRYETRRVYLCVSSTMEQYDGSGSSTSEYEYDEFGRLVTRWSVDASGSRQGSTVYSYDEKGNLIKETGSSGGYYLYTYDRDGNCLSSEYYGANGEISSRYTYTYDSEGYLIDELTEYYFNDSIYHYSYSYNEDYTERTTYRISEEDTYVSGVTCLDAAGNVLSSSSYYSDGALGSSIAYTYDAEGRLIREDTYHDSELQYDYSVYYTYDEHGNLTFKDVDYYYGYGMTYVYEEFEILVPVTD